jgi:uncharacterized protein YkwD
MRLLISLLLSVFLVGTGYWIYSRFVYQPEAVEIAESPHNPVKPPDRPRVETPPPTPTPPPSASPPASPTPAPPAPVEQAPPPASVPPEKPPQIDWSAVEKRVFELTNEARKHARVNPLLPEDGLHECAVVQSADMIERKFFDHINPSGEDPSDRLARIHRRLVGTAGENIWEATGDSFPNRPDLADLIVDGWMHSPHHRENILRPDFTHLGVGVVIRGTEVRATQSFARVRAYLNVPLPSTIQVGTPVNLTSRGPSPLAELYSLKAMRGTRQPASPATLPIEGATFNVPGKYRLELCFPIEGNRLAVFGGPSITVVK